MKYSVVDYGKLDDELRLDAEFYRPEVLQIENLLDQKNSVNLSTLADFVIGPFGSTVTVDMYVENSNYKYIRNKDNNGLYLRDDDPTFIPDSVFSSLPQFHIKENDLLITVVGTLGKVAIAQKKDTNSIFSCKSTIIRSKKIDPFYLLTYLNSSIGQLFCLRGTRGAIQQGLNLTDIKKIRVFIANDNFQGLIRKTVEDSLHLIEESKSLYRQAEERLLTELGLLHWHSEHQLYFVRSYHEIEQEGRFDADYFQPKYYEVEEILSRRQQKTLDELCSQINYGTVPTSPYSEDGIPYIKGLNLVDGFVQGNLDLLENTNSLPRKFYTKENDIIISQMGTVGKAAIITRNEIECLFASFTIGIRLRDYKFINPYVLTLYINIVSREWYLLRRIAQASVRQNTDLPTIRQLHVPQIDPVVQQEIKKNILDSRRKKVLSKQLFEIAKHAVEIATEQDESIAKTWLKKKILTLGIRLDI